MIKKNSLLVKIWKYLILFSILVLAFLWLFQVIFLNSYYKNVKTRELKEVGATLKKKKNLDNLDEIIDDISYDKSICVLITDSDISEVQSSSFVSRGCMMDMHTNSYLEEFIESNLSKKLYELTNPRFKNEILIYAIKLDDDLYAFINTSIDPMDSTAAILKNQLVIVTVVVLLLSVVIAYFISRYISNPIVKISNDARGLAKGKYDTKFGSREDIYEVNELVEALNSTQNELRKTDELRRDLMANVSHDLKTPLTMIKAYAEMARDLNDEKREKRHDNLNVIIEEVDRLTVLVNDILDLSKLQSNIEDLKLEKVDLIVLIENILNRYKIYTELEDYNFIFSHNKDKILVDADNKKLEQVIYNLINNAINYTGGDNKVFIRVTDKDSKILVEIIDTGKGIKEDDINLIWDKYYKNKKKHKRNLIGTGLGLSIVKNILEEHNFKYGVKNERDMGANFYFEIKK